ncbi:hypothetical protein ACFX2I_010169 [Malus domestica]
MDSMLELLSPAEHRMDIGLGKKHRYDSWGSSDVLAVTTPNSSEDLEYLKSSALNIWLAGYEFPETIMVVMKKQIHFSCSQASFLKVLKKPAKKAVALWV